MSVSRPPRWFVHMTTLVDYSAVRLTRTILNWGVPFRPKFNWDITPWLPLRVQNKYTVTQCVQVVLAAM